MSELNYVIVVPSLTSQRSVLLPLMTSQAYVMVPQPDGSVINDSRANVKVSPLYLYSSGLLYTDAVKLRIVAQRPIISIVVAISAFTSG